MKISDKDPATMTPGQINKELDRLEAYNSVLGDRMIAAGRGHEKPSEYLKKDDPLAKECQKVSERFYALRQEIRQRTGSPYMFRLPDTGRDARFVARRRKD